MPCLGSTVELAQDVGVVGETTRGQECGRADPASCLLWGSISEGEVSLPSFLLSPLAAGERAGYYGLMRAGKLALSFINCSTRVGRPCTSPG